MGTESGSKAPAVGGKKFTSSLHQGDAGVALIHLLVSEMGHVWHDRVNDVGIDGSIELRDPATGEMSNRHILVQSKASGTLFPGEDDSRFWYNCDSRDVDYWMRATDPVIVVCSHPASREAWWAHVQPWFDNPPNRASLRLEFNKATQRLEDDITGRLFAIADPHGRAHTPAADFAEETLISNLLTVEVPEVIYSAPTSIGKISAIYGAQRKTKYPIRNDFVLSNSRLFTWSPTFGTALAHVPDAAARERPIGELLEQGADGRRLLVRLLNAALQHDLRDTCRWNNDRRFIHFRPTEDLRPKQVRSATGNARIVFKGYYQRRDDPTKPQFYRHAALRWQFTEIDRAWFCALQPDYFFSSDGFAESPFADRYLKRIKTIERNEARLGETRLWGGILRGELEPTLFDPVPDRILEYGNLVEFTLDRGLRDADWVSGGEVISESTEARDAGGLLDYEDDLLVDAVAGDVGDDE